MWILDGLDGLTLCIGVGEGRAGRYGETRGYPRSNLVARQGDLARINR